MSAPAETSDGDRRLRRPSDLRKEGTPHRGRPHRRDEPPLSWPERFVDSEGDRAALIILLHLASLTPRRLLELAQQNRTAASCLDAVAHGAAASDSDRTLAEAIRPDEVRSQSRELGARLVAVGDPEYPPELLDLFDPPAGLFVRGRPLGELTPRVAMVGARNCSPSGREVATVLARALAHAGVCVVSGGARGIDGAAHRGALRAGGHTISVMGCGIDILYPGQNRALLQEIVASGAVVSEYPPGTPAEPFRFPARNRIVAALSRAVVVVEGAAGSGSMITADHALDVGRDVLAVPGAVSSPLAAVPLALIRDGATLVRGPRDLLGDLGLAVTVPEGHRGGTSEGGEGGGPGSISAGERAVWETLTVAMAPDSVAEAAGLPLPEVMSALVGLELRGKVRQIGGRYERRLEGSP
jgi:DNA processing protein